MCNKRATLQNNSLPSACWRWQNAANLARPLLESLVWPLPLARLYLLNPQFFLQESRLQRESCLNDQPKKLTIWKCVNVGGRLEISFFGEPTYDNWSTRRCTVTTIRSAGGLFLSRMGEALEMISSGMSLFLFPCQIGLIILVVKVAR